MRPILRPSPSYQHTNGTATLIIQKVEEKDGSNKESN
uniref:Uncharacterized protein n=1 Tax=Parascaris univalens TaxID=6257 RepID=A0A915A4Z6_PARUN